jgi:hypothetical protein
MRIFLRIACARHAQASEEKAEKAANGRKNWVIERTGKSTAPVARE